MAIRFAAAVEGPPESRLCEPPGLPSALALQSVHSVAGAFVPSTVSTCKFYLQPVSGRQRLPAEDRKDH